MATSGPWRKTSVSLSNGKRVEGCVDARGWFGVDRNTGLVCTGMLPSLTASARITRPIRKGDQDYRELYVLTHLASGRAVALAEDPEELLSLAERLVGPGWGMETPTAAMVDELEALLPSMEASEGLEVNLPGGVWAASGRQSDDLVARLGVGAGGGERSSGGR